MSYPISAINSFVEDEDNEFEGSWGEFRYALEPNWENIQNPDPSEVTGTRFIDDDGFLREPSPINPNYNQYVRRLAEKQGVDIPGVGNAVLVEEFGGEGQGDQLWFVFKITDAAGDVRYFRRNGWYQSYSGGEYDGPTEEVEPAEKTITVWNKKKVKK
ncbi:hypothetical protein SEA_WILLIAMBOONE_16 [Gordonia phage WilliamBoone]|nr:hypothetical protein SEA_WILLIAMBOONE_16 [Gordonia phage WilliamBoone]